MTERCACGAEDWVVLSTEQGTAEGVVCGICGADAPGDVAAVLTAEHVLETASTSAHAERLESFADALPDPPSWIESAETRRAWTAYQRMRRDMFSEAGGALPFVEFPQRDDRRDRRRSWSWGSVAIGIAAASFVVAFWAAIIAIIVEALS